MTPREGPHETAAEEAAEVLDCSGLLCPLPVYLTSKALARLRPGDLLRVVCTDPGSVADFPAFAAQGTHELLRAKASDGVHTFLLRRGADR